MQDKIIAALVSVIALAAAMLFYGHFQYDKGVEITTLTYETAIAEQKNAAAQQLVVENTKVAEKEHSLQAAKATQDITDARHTQTIHDLSSQLRDALDANSRMCDPSGCGGRGSNTDGSSVSSPNNSTNNSAGNDGVLSADLAQLLEQLTLKADTVNNAYNACRADAFTIRGILK